MRGIYDYGTEDKEADEEYDDCHMLPDGICMAAGSEYCDWECPVMRRLMTATTPAEGF